MPRQVTFTVEINSEGDAIIRLPEGKRQQGDAAKIAPLTEQLAKAIGKITERHVGEHHHHDHGHDHGHDHQEA